MNYTKLFADKNEGKISKDITLVMDNDGGGWMCNNEDLTEEEQEKLADEYEKRYGRPNGYNDIVDILNAAGIKTEWC